MVNFRNLAEVEAALDEAIRRIEILDADLERAERIARAVGSLYVAGLIAEAREKAGL